MGLSSNQQTAFSSGRYPLIGFGDKVCDRAVVVYHCITVCQMSFFLTHSASSGSLREDMRDCFWESGTSVSGSTCGWLADMCCPTVLAWHCLLSIFFIMS